MDSSFAELTHAVPDHGSFFAGAGVADITGIKSTVATGAGSGLISAPNGADSSSGSGSGGGNNGSPDTDSAVAATMAATIGTGSGIGTGTVATRTSAAAPARAAPTSQPKSGIFSSAQFSAHTQVHAQVPAPAAPAAPAPSAHAPAPAPAPAPTAPAAAPSPQAPQAFSSFPSSSSPSTPDLNYHSPPPPPSTSPPSTHNVLHAHRQSHNSSKLPAYRFADLNKESIALPSLLQHQRQQHRIPPSPVSPDSDQRPETLPNTVNQFSPPKVPGTATTQKRKTTHDAVSPVPPSAQFDPIRSRASTFQPKSASLPTTTPSTHVKRSTSLDNASAVPNTAGVRSPSGSSETVITALKRRAPTSPITPSAQDTDAASGGSPAEATKRESLPGQRELLLPKALKRTASDDRRVSISRKPPVSYKPRTNTSVSGVTASIPPIRSFRSSGERRSLVLDMNVRSSRNYDGGDDLGDSNHRDRTLRALEGRRGDEVMQWTPPDSAGERPDGDDSGDLFLKIAREDTVQRPTDNGRTYHADKTYHTDNPNAISRVARSARRPLSVAISSYRSPSPPRISRRLSEQESRVRGLGHDQGERTGPPVSYRGHSREPHSEDLKLRSASTSIRASPLTPRTLTYQDPSESTSAHRRRQPSIDRGSAALPRMTSLKQVNVNYSHPRAYNSSPLVSHADPPKHEAQSNEPVSIEGTDSTTSTAAPSTVWDELEELKSRIHRLELTGKLPPTSSAAISRASDDRPPTAHTNATTLSASPKRGASSAVQSTDSPSVPKDSHPLLNSALAKSKDFLAPEVYDALETATIDALSLAAMMGTAGQPGPISSGSSNIGSNTGTVTDRQLRKKADSICRSLTELCLALSENGGAVKPQQITVPPSEDATVTLASPTITQFSGVATQRRPSAPANRALELATSPRTLSRYEDKRATILASSALPSPRYNANIPTTPDAPTAAAAGRKSSLLFSRARRAGTEEPEDGRKTSTLVRSRRAGTEEPEDPLDRKPILSRGRRATLDNGEDESRFRTPSRAITEVNGLRPREYISQLHPPPITKDVETLANSALPRRRLGSTTISTRLAQATAVTTPPSAIVTPNRRYVERSTPGRETVLESVEDRPQRQFSLARSGSLNRRATNRQSMIATPSTTTTSYYR